MKMSLNIQESQRNAVVEMLSLSNLSKDLYGGGAQLWKVLIYDRVCQNMLSPLMKVGSLRQHGVTLNLLLEADRTPVPDVPAIYIIEPTEENIQRVIKDITKHLYRSYYINFSTTISSSLLEKFAMLTSTTNCAQQISVVADRFIQFVSLSPFEFSLDINNAFCIFHDTKQLDQEIEECLARLTDGLLSMIVTIGVVPVIRCPGTPSSPASIIGQRLNNAIKLLLSRRGQGAAASQLFSNSSRPGSSILERPLLILFDREIDFSVMLHHTWSYQALVHDLFNLRLNRVVIPLSDEEKLNKKPSELKPKMFDIDASDTLWAEFGSRAFPEAAVAISEAFQDYTTKKSQIDEANDSAHSDGVQSTLLTLSAVPEMIMKKKSIDLHTTIAHAIVAEITARGLDKFYEIEDLFETGSVTTAMTQLEKIFTDQEKGTVMDKSRAAVCFYLAKHNQLNASQLTKLKDKIIGIGGSPASINFIQHLESFKAMQKTTPHSQASYTVPTTQSAWGANFLDRSKGLLQGVRNLLPLKKTLPIAAATNDLMQNKPGSLLHQEFLYLDPKISVQLGVADDAAPRIKSSFRQSIVFVIGGGSYVESHALKEMATKNGKQIIYGTTDFITPNKFLEDLQKIGTSV